MESGRQMALAIGTGYLLGRGRKRKLAIMAGAVAMAGASTGPVGQVLRRGAKLAGSRLGSAGVLGKVPPEAGEIAGMIRGDLLEAGKGAARTAVSSRIDSLSDQLQGRAETLRNPAASGAGDSAPAGRQEDEGRQAPRQPATRTRRSASSGSAPRRRAAAQGGSTAGAERRPARQAASARSAGSGRPVRRATRSAREGR